MKLLLTYNMYISIHTLISEFWWIHYFVQSAYKTGLGVLMMRSHNCILVILYVSRAEVELNRVLVGKNLLTINK